MIHYDISFIRNLSDDLEVIANKGWKTSVTALTTQLHQELDAFVPAGMAFKTSRDYVRNDDGEEYTLTGTISAPDQHVSPSTENVAEARCAALNEMVASLQVAYEEGASGRFTIDALTIDGTAFTADEIIAADAEAGLNSGRDLLDLSPGEIFDRTKMQTDNVVLIASGTFADSIYNNNTAYAVGIVDEEGGFKPIRSNMRYGNALGLFKEVVSPTNPNSLAYVTGAVKKALGSIKESFRDHTNGL